MKAIVPSSGQGVSFVDASLDPTQTTQPNKDWARTAKNVVAVALVTIGALIALGSALGIPVVTVIVLNQAVTALPFFGSIAGTFFGIALIFAGGALYKKREKPKEEEETQGLLPLKGNNLQKQFARLTEGNNTPLPSDLTSASE